MNDKSYSTLFGNKMHCEIILLRCMVPYAMVGYSENRHSTKGQDNHRRH